jgi:hypothetical protein
MSKITTESTAKDNQQQIDWATTIGFNIFIFIGEYVLGFIFGNIIDLFDRVFKTEIVNSLLRYVGETPGIYNSVAIGELIKLPLIFLLILNILIIVIWKKLPFKLYKSKI